MQRADRHGRIVSFYRFSLSLWSSFAATRDLVLVWRSGDFFHASFVATRILTIPLRVLHLGNDFPCLAAGIVLVCVRGHFKLAALFAAPTRHELVLIHVIFVEVVARVLNEMRHGALKIRESE